jgi:hypothetical protein
MITSRRMTWTGHVARMEVKWKTYRLLVVKLDGKIPLGRPICMWMDYIRLDLGVVWTGLVWLKIETSGELF